MKYKLRQRTLLMHVFFFFFFLIIPALLFERMPGETVFSTSRMIVQDAVANLFLLAFFYLNYYVFLPKYFFSKKYLLYALFVVGFLCIAFALPHLIVDGLNLGQLRTPPPVGGHLPPPDGHLPMINDAQHRPPRQQPLFSFSMRELRRHLYLFFTAFFFSFLLKTQDHLSQLKEDKLNAELSSLKAQINPHFLFNTLNTIYALSIKKDDNAGEAIVHLSGLMRYVTKDVNENNIPLQKEIDYVTNYIELQKARLGSTAQVYYDVAGFAGNKQITPLILITYIENAFKYGVNPNVTDCIVSIQIYMTDTGITLYTYNKKVPNLNQMESTGIGMRNTGERLKHLYPKKHSLEIVDNENDYSLTLSITLI
ncbi:MAG: sensor histidine kinase [Chitinophagaceae bacterium]